MFGKAKKEVGVGDRARSKKRNAVKATSGAEKKGSLHTV